MHVIVKSRTIYTLVPMYTTLFFVCEHIEEPLKMDVRFPIITPYDNSQYLGVYLEENTKMIFYVFYIITIIDKPKKPFRIIYL